MRYEYVPPAERRRRASLAAETTARQRSEVDARSRQDRAALIERVRRNIGWLIDRPGQGLHVEVLHSVTKQDLRRNRSREGLELVRGEYWELEVTEGALVVNAFMDYVPEYASDGTHVRNNQTFGHGLVARDGRVWASDFWPAADGQGIYQAKADAAQRIEEVADLGYLNRRIRWDD